MDNSATNSSLLEFAFKELKKENLELREMVGSLPKEDELKAQKELLILQGTALESAANGIVITDAKGNINWVNPAFVKLTGYSKSEVLSQNSRILKSGLHDDNYYKDLWETISTGKVWTGEVVNKKKDGSHYYEEMTITPVIDSQGKIANYIAIKSNISKRKKVEKELHDSQNKFRQLIQNATVGILRIDTDGEIIMANPAFVEMLGYESQAEIISQKSLELFQSPLALEKLLNTLKRQEKFSNYEEILVKRDGSNIDVSKNAWAIKDNNDNVIYYEIIVKDITEQNQVLQILHESEFKYRMLIDKLNEAVYLLIGRKFELVNSKFLDLLGITDEELQSPSFNIFDFLDPASKNYMLERETDIAKGKEVPAKYLITIINKTGDEREVEVSVSFINYNGKQATQGVVRDLTEIKKTETQIRHLQKMEAIGTLAAGIAHEINTPSQFINDNLSFLKGAQQELEPIYKFLTKIKEDKVEIDELKQLLKNVDVEYLQGELPIAIEQSLEGVQRIATIVSAMRDFSHSGPRERVAADLHKLINNSITISKNAWKYIATIETDYDESIQPITCLASDLGQVVVNMIVNSSHALENKFKDSGTVEGKILVKTQNKNDYVEIIISDNGSGMPAKVKKRVFDPFFTTKEVGKGTGQGLAIAYDIIVDKHNGSISVESEENEGTTFTIHLPNK